MKTKIKNFLKESYKFIIFLIILVSAFYIKLPYYIMAPGGVINITNRVDMEGYESSEKGSLNMLYVSEYNGTIMSLLFAKLKNWDIEKNESRQISNESISDIEERNKIMRDNSLDIAMLVAYTEADKKINVKTMENKVIATTVSNGLKVGDVIKEVNNISCNNIEEIKEIITSSEVGDYVTFKILRNNNEMLVKSKVILENNTKVIGVVIVTEYDYDIDPKINIKFKNSESGASGGLMLTLTIYNAISDEDIIKGRNIAGTGTISEDGTVGEIDGIKYKIMGAVNDKMDLVLVPSENYEEAIRVKEKYNYDIEIIKVDSFKTAIEYLKNN